MKPNKLFKSKFRFPGSKIEYSTTTYGMPTYSLWDKIKIIWKSRSKIFNGIWHSLFPSAYVERVASERLKACRTNTCGFYDKEGVMEKTIVKGSESCGNCGCVLKYKIRSLSSSCPMTELGYKGYWEARMTEFEEDNFRNKTGIKNE